MTIILAILTKAILTDPNVWSAFVATLALILSQVPPVWKLLKGEKIKIIVPEIFTLDHYFGNALINLSIDIQNIGGKDVSISKIDCVIKDPQENILHLPARTYYSRQQPSQLGMTWQQFPLGYILLKPEENWSETISCFELFDETDEEQLNDIVFQIQESIPSATPSTFLGSYGRSIEADEQLVSRVNLLFNKLFKLHKVSMNFSSLPCLRKVQSLL